MLAAAVRTARTVRAWIEILLRRPPHAIEVWDLGVRVFHWLLVIAVSLDALTGFFATRSGLAVHLWAGAVLAALIGWRLIWGFMGGGHARFRNFLYGPRATLAHARGLLDNTARRYVGHNPLGSAMVYAMLAVLVLIVLTGTAALGGMFKQGPLAASLMFETGATLLGLHNFLAGLFVAMIAVHLGGVAFETWRERENLVGAMITGAKVAGAAAAPPGRARPRLALVLAAALVILAGFGAVRLAARPVPGLPPATLDPVYARECGDCHFAYPPSIAPAATWAAIMAHLDQHFGEDASLDVATRTRIAAYLAANSAEHWDTLAARRLATSFDPSHPLRVTGAGLWRRMHGRIPDETFADKRVGGRGQCDACHADAASGLFAPQNIAIPEAAE
jgi:cytochrome b